jgi:hypothetical protein
MKKLQIIILTTIIGMLVALNSYSQKSLTLVNYHGEIVKQFEDSVQIKVIIKTKEGKDKIKGIYYILNDSIIIIDSQLVNIYHIKRFVINPRKKIIAGQIVALKSVTTLFFGLIAYEIYDNICGNCVQSSALKYFVSDILMFYAAYGLFAAPAYFSVGQGISFINGTRLSEFAKLRIKDKTHKKK